MDPLPHDNAIHSIGFLRERIRNLPVVSETSQLPEWVLVV